MLAELDPFSPAVPDESAEFEALVRAFRMARGFTLLFVTCNRADLRDRLIAELSERLSPFRSQIISIDRPIDHLLDRLRHDLTSPPPDAVFITGLEAWLPAGEAGETSPL